MDWLVSIIGGLVVAFIGFLAKTFWNNKKSKEDNSEFIYLWSPDEILRNNLENVKPISEYPRDILFDFESSNDIAVENGDFKTVSGLDAFKQAVTKFVNTERDKYEIYQDTNYGLSYMFQTMNSNDEFQRLSEISAKEIMLFFNEWIKDFHFIKKYKNKEYLQIGIGLRSYNEIVKFDIFLLK